MNSSTKLDLPLCYKLGGTEDGQCHFLCFLAFIEWWSMAGHHWIACFFVVRFWPTLLTKIHEYSSLIRPHLNPSYATDSASLMVYMRVDTSQTSHWAADSTQSCSWLLHRAIQK